MCTESPCKMFFLLPVEIKEVKILRHIHLGAMENKRAMNVEKNIHLTQLM